MQNLDNYTKPFKAYIENVAAVVNVASNVRNKYKITESRIAERFDVTFKHGELALIFSPKSWTSIDDPVYEVLIHTDRGAIYHEFKGQILQ